jgi:hypothetical protein
VTASRVRALVLAALIAVCATGRSEAADPETPASPSHTPAGQAEVWYFHQNTTATSQQDRLTLRLYQPFFFDNGWQITFREDIRGLHTNQVGTDNPNGAWSTHLGDMFAQAALKTPHIAPGLAVDLGLRVFFPTGNLPPFGTGRYQVGPHFGFIWDVPGAAGVVTLAPLVRYMTSFGDQPTHSTETNEVQIHPIIAVKPWTGWAVTFWREHPLILDARTNKWFVPFDVMVSHEILPHLSLSAGVAVSLLADNPQYDNIVYGRVALSF